MGTYWRNYSGALISELPPVNETYMSFVIQF